MHQANILPIIWVSCSLGTESPAEKEFAAREKFKQKFRSRVKILEHFFCMLLKKKRNKSFITHRCPRKLGAHFSRAALTMPALVLITIFCFCCIKFMWTRMNFESRFVHAVAH